MKRDLSLGRDTPIKFYIVFFYQVAKLISLIPMLNIEPNICSSVNMLTRIFR